MDGWMDGWMDLTICVVAVWLLGMKRSFGTSSPRNRSVSRFSEVGRGMKTGLSISAVSFVLFDPLHISFHKTFPQTNPPSRIIRCLILII